MSVWSLVNGRGNLQLPIKYIIVLIAYVTVFKNVGYLPINSIFIVNIMLSVHV